MNARPLLAGLLLTALLTALPAVDAQQPTHKPGGFHSPDIQAKSFWDLRLSDPGVYYYHCHPHPFMQGEIEVTPNAPSGTVQVTIRDFDFQPKRIQVRPNETIHFVNNGPSMHTVDESVPPANPEKTGGESPAPGFVVALVAILVALLRGRR